MRIGMVCPYSFDVPGGVQSHVLQLAEVMHGYGHEVSVLAPASAEAHVSLPDYVVLTPSLHKNGGLAHVTRAMDRALARLGREGQPEGKGETTASVCHVACPVEVFGDVGAHTVPAAAVF